MYPPHFDIEKVIRPNILALTPYRCARDDYQSGILLDANENAIGHVLISGQLNETNDANEGSCDNGLPMVNGLSSTQADSDRLSVFASLDLHRYPDPAQTQIKSRIVDLRRLSSPSNVFLGVGSDEVIDLLMRICCVPSKDKILITPPTYGMYAVCAQVNDVGVVKVPLVNKGPEGHKQFQLDIKSIKQAIKADSSIKLIFLCSPGNPTGTLIPISDIRQLLENPDFKGVVIVDEAYIDFADPRSDGEGSSDISAVQLVQNYANICVMQTLSKSFGLAAIRLGIALAQSPLIQMLSNTKAPYNISTPSSMLALEALLPSSIELMRRTVKTLNKGREDLIAEFARLTKLGLGLGKPLGGNHANFVLVPVLQKGTEKASCDRAVKVYKELAEKRGIVVRYRGDQLGCDGCLRVTVGTPEENRVIITQLADVLKIL